jgi:AAA family ATP:ADP antiporter
MEEGCFMFSYIARTLWGDISREELKKFGLLSGVFFFIVGAYWLVRSLKEVIFANTVGKMYLPYAKIASLICLVFVLMFYSKLVDWLSKYRLIYVLSGFFGAFFAILALLVMHPTIGLANTTTDKYRFFGWAAYAGIEILGSLLPGLFWAFVNSSMDTAAAKKGYPIILAGAQMGSILGSYLCTHASFLGIGALFGIGSASILVVPLMIKWFVSQHPDALTERQATKSQSTGMFEGLRLLFSKSYLIGILAVSTLYEVVGEIINMQMKLTAVDTYPTPEKLAEFMGFFGVSVNTLSLIFAIVGTSFFIRRFGFTFCLVAYPVTIATAVCCTWTFQGLWVFFGAMVALKGLSYALNNPCKEVMYIPTSKDIKFKAKGWMEGFGSRTAKGSGASIVAAIVGSANMVAYGSLISLGIIFTVWIPAALFVGRTNNKLVQEGKIIE